MTCHVNGLMRASERNNIHTKTQDFHKLWHIFKVKTLSLEMSSLLKIAEISTVGKGTVVLGV